MGLMGWLKRDRGGEGVEVGHQVRAVVGEGWLPGADAAEVDCWVVRSAGLRRLRQKELLFAVAKGAGQTADGAAPMPLTFMRAVATLAVQGRLVDVGGVTEFGPRGFFAQGILGNPGVRAVGYAPAHGADHLVPEGNAQEYLAVLQLWPAELEAARVFGLARVLAQMGRTVYPYPLWNDPGRAAVLTSQQNAASVLTRFGGRVVLAGCMVYQQDGKVTLEIPRDQAKELATAAMACARQNTGLVVPLTRGWTEARACLVWEPGATSPSAIGAAPEDSVLTPESRQRVLGCFVALVPGATQEGAMMVEDGFFVALGRQRAEVLGRALLKGTPFGMQGTEGMMGFGMVLR